MFINNFIFQYNKNNCPKCLKKNDLIYIYFKLLAKHIMLNKGLQQNPYFSFIFEKDANPYLPSNKFVCVYLSRFQQKGQRNTLIHQILYSDWIFPLFIDLSISGFPKILTFDRTFSFLQMGTPRSTSIFK